MVDNAHRSHSADPDPGGGGGVPQPSTAQPPLSPPTRDYGGAGGGAVGTPAYGTPRSPPSASATAGELYDYGPELYATSAAPGAASSSGYPYGMRSTSAAASELYVSISTSSARARPPTSETGGASDHYVTSPPLASSGRGHQPLSVSSVGAVSTESPEDDFDYGQNNVPLLQAQLKVGHGRCFLFFGSFFCISHFQLVTHERDMLTKDVKRYAMEREVAAAAAAATSGGKFNRHPVAFPTGGGSQNYRTYKRPIDSSTLNFSYWRRVGPSPQPHCI